MICTHCIGFLIAWIQEVLRKPQIHNLYYWSWLFCTSRFESVRPTLRYMFIPIKGFLRISEIWMLPSFSPRKYESFFGLPSSIFEPKCYFYSQKFWELEWKSLCNELLFAHPRQFSMFIHYTVRLSHLGTIVILWGKVRVIWHSIKCIQSADMLLYFWLQINKD